MLVIDDLTFSIAGKPLFKEASARIPEGHKIGFVGRNGTGKTTLFRLIERELTPDSGSITLPKSARIGSVKQEVPASAQTLIEIVLASDTQRTQLLERAEIETDPQAIAEIQEKLTEIGAYSAEARAATILYGLGFDAEAQSRPSSEFSGGWRMRVALAATLFAKPDYLLLDEPTNYLDLEGALWLENFIAAYRGTVLLISHERSFLDNAVSEILHFHDYKLKLYSGGYSSFETQRIAHVGQLEAMAKKQAARKAEISQFVERFRAKATKAKQAQSRLKMLERMKDIELIQDQAVAKFHFPECELLAPPILKLEDVCAGYGSTAILKNLSLRIDPDDRIALLGANGQGKSTLAKTIADELPLLSGSKITASKLRIGYFAQHQVDALRLEQTPIDHVRQRHPDMAQSKLRAILARGGIGADIAETKVDHLSGGQKNRLAMLLVTLNDPHLLILDEPTNHLDIQSRDALISAINSFNGAVILVSHDMYLLEAVADRLWLVNTGKVVPFEDDLHAYRDFILSKNKPDKAETTLNQKTQKRKDNAQKREALAPLRAEITRCEERVEKIVKMQETIDIRLADPELYAQNSSQKIEELQIKRAEILKALEKAENLWLEALDKYEMAQND